jgi:ribosome recycling factor
MAEESKVAIRNVRRDELDKAKAQQKDGELTEDELKQAENEIQKLTDKFIAQIDSVVGTKETEIMSV